MTNRIAKESNQGQIKEEMSKACATAHTLRVRKHKE